MREVCGAATRTAHYPPLPLPEGGELVHATDQERTVLFLWRPRWIDPNTNEPRLDMQRVHVARVDLDDGEEPRVLNISVNAIDNSSWVSAIIEATGFDLHYCTFKSTSEDKVPPSHWRLLQDAVRRREKERADG